jgi:hypothetical protein
MDEIDLSACEKGDILISRCGTVLRYSRALPENNSYDHEIIYPNGASGTRTNDGHVYCYNRNSEDGDIVRIIHDSEDIVRIIHDGEIADIYITKYALTKGIFKQKCKIKYLVHINKIYAYPLKGIYYQNELFVMDDFTFTESQAIEIVKYKKIKSLENEINKIKNDKIKLI